MTTLTLRVDLYNKTVSPALADEPEAIAVGETVKLRLLGLGITAAEANAVVATDLTPPLRARVRSDEIGDIAMYPFPGDEPAWTVEAVGDETALCCLLDLGTAQAYGLFGGMQLADGARRKVRLLVERGYPNASPALYASDRLALASWSFPGHSLRVLTEPARTELTADQVQRLFSAAIAAVAEQFAGQNAAALQAAQEALAAAAAELAAGTTDGEALAGVTAALKAAILAEAKAYTDAKTASSNEAVEAARTAVGEIVQAAQTQIGAAADAVDAKIAALGDTVKTAGDQTVGGVKTFQDGIEIGGDGGNAGPLKMEAVWSEENNELKLVFLVKFNLDPGVEEICLGSASEENRLLRRRDAMQLLRDLAWSLGMAQDQHGNWMAYDLVQGEYYGGFINISPARINRLLEKTFGIYVDQSGQDAVDGYQRMRALLDDLGLLPGDDGGGGDGQSVPAVDPSKVIESILAMLRKLMERLDDLDGGGDDDKDFCDRVNDCIGDRLDGIEDTLAAHSSAIHQLEDRMDLAEAAIAALQNRLPPAEGGGEGGEGGDDGGDPPDPPPEEEDPLPPPLD